jgi:serine/threonine protein kinase
VLIGDDGEALVCDFGISVIHAEFEKTPYRGAARWLAPELCGEGGDKNVTKFNDIYSIGSVMLQVSPRLKVVKTSSSCSSLGALWRDPVLQREVRPGGPRTPFAEHQARKTAATSDNGRALAIHQSLLGQHPRRQA